MSRSTLKTSAINAEIRKAQVAAAAPAAPAGKKATAKDKPAAAAPKGAGEIRIIGGAWKRTRLPVAQRPGLRPTPDRVRETLFNWLGQDLDGWHCLDLFAGSGALGFEAASRGAARVVMIEQAPKVLAALHENHELLHKPSGVEIIRADAIQYLASTQAKFDLIFLDPPYKKGWISRLEPLLPGVLNEDAAIYVEAEHEVESLGDWRTVRQGKAGEVHFHLLRRETGGKSA